jgi:hypothetical protein
MGFKRDKMNRKLIIAFLFTIVAAGMYSCKKDSDVFIPDVKATQGPDTNWVNIITDSMPVNTIKKQLFPELYLDSIEVNANPAYVISPSGLACGFPPFCCAGTAGQAITGKVYVELLLIRKKGDMIRADKPTSSYNRLLVSGGEMFVKLTKNGQELKLAPGKSITLRYNDAPILPGMKVFYGDESNADQFNWNPSDSINLPQVISGNNFYELTSKQLRWINCDYFYDTTGITRVQVGANLAPQYTNANTSVYLVLSTMRSVLGMYGNAVTRKFISGKVPVGQQAKVIVLSKQGSDYYLGSESLVTGPQASAPAGQQFVPINPVKTSLADIKTFLSTL